jgi:hypothetical protein
MDISPGEKVQKDEPIAIDLHGQLRILGIAFIEIP